MVRTGLAGLYLQQTHYTEAEAIYREGLKNVTAGANPMSLKRGVEKATVAVVAGIARQSKKVKEHTEIAQVATSARAAASRARLRANSA